MQPSSLAIGLALLLVNLELARIVVEMRRRKIQRDHKRMIFRISSQKIHQSQPHSSSQVPKDAYQLQQEIARQSMLLLQPQPRNQAHQQAQPKHQTLPDTPTSAMANYQALAGAEDQRAAPPMQAEAVHKQMAAVIDTSQDTPRVPDRFESSSRCETASVGSQRIILMNLISSKMNLVSSKVMKSSRPIGNRSVETMNSFSCQLYIQSFRLSYRGFVLFLWSCGNAQTQSLRYESQGRQVQVKQTLTLSLRIASRNGKEAHTKSTLKLVAQNGEELDQQEISLNNLSSQFKENEIPMDRGLVSVRLRRKLLNSAEEEEVGFQAGFYRSKVHRMEEKSLTHLMTGEYETLQEQLGRTKKELEDAVYLNNKLKNDREVLLATKQQLELQIQTMIVQITKEISVLREHYQNRMAIREHCYEQQIQQIVNGFNVNSQQTRKTIQLILKQKNKLQDEYKPILQKLKKKQAQLALKIQEKDEIQRQRQQAQTRIANLQETIFIRDQQIMSLNTDKLHLSEEIHSLNAQVEELMQQIDHQRQSLQQKQNLIVDFQGQMQKFKAQLQSKTREISQLQHKLGQGKQREGIFDEQKHLLQQQISLLQSQKGRNAEQTETLRARLTEYEYQMEFNENVMGQLKRQQQQKEEQLYGQLDGLEKLYSSKMEDIINSFHGQRDELRGLNAQLAAQKDAIEQRLKQLQMQLHGSQLKLNELGTQFNQINNQLRNNNEHLSRKDMKMQQLNQQIESLRKEIERLQSKGNDQTQNPPQQLQINQNAQKLRLLQEQLKRLVILNDSKDRNIEQLKAEIARLGESREKKKMSKSGRQLEIQQVVGGPGTLKEQDLKQIVYVKEEQIRQLRKRVQFLQGLFQLIQNKFDEISKKYPQIDLGNLQAPLPKPQQWCDSEQQQEKVINQLSDKHDPPLRPKKQSRKNSIGQTIFQNDEDAYSHTSSKVLRQRKSFEPRSQKRITSEQQQKGIYRRDSMGVGKVTIQIPKGASIRRQPSNGSYDPSQRSGASYIKVSHSKKIRELQEQVRQLAQKEKGYQAQIDDYLKSIDALKKQIAAVRAQLKEQAQRLQQTQQNHNPNHKPSSPRHEVRKENKQSQVFIEDERLKNFMHESQIRQLQLQKLYLRIGELQDNLKNQRNQKGNAQNRITQLDVRAAQFQRISIENLRKAQQAQQALKILQKSIDELQQKLRKERESAQQARLSAKQLHLHLDTAQGELKKAKSMIETLEQRLQKLAGNEALVRQMARQLQEASKKALEQTRTYNHIRLEKQSGQEEMRLLKKRQNDHLRIATEWEQKAASLQRAIEELKRREGKLRRQGEQASQQTRRARAQTKKTQQQLQALAASQAGHQAQRRKHLDEISSLQDQIARKDYELAKLGKQMQKWKARAEDRQQTRLGKRGQLREEIDRLESQLIRRQKKLLEQSEQNKLLRGRMQLLQRENKRMIEQKNQTYGQKLKYYVEEMSNIKRLLEEYQNQNSRLKIDNNDFYQQLQMLKMNFDKLQMKYDENMQRQQTILNDLQSYLHQVGTLKDRLASAHQQIDQAQSSFASARKALQDEKIQGKKLLQRLQNTQRALQRSNAESRQLKIRISEFETSNQINGKMGERYRALERKKNQLQEEFRKLKYQYDNAISLFVYKREDLEKAVNDVRTQERRRSEQEVAKLHEQYAKTVVAKTQRLQQEILDLFNENSRIRNQLQCLHEENGKLKGRLSQLQAISQRFGSLQGENQMNKIIIDEHKDQIRKRNDRISKLQISLQSSEVQCSSKERELTNIRNRLSELEKTIDKLNKQVQQRKASQRQLQDAIIRAGQSKNRQKSQEELYYKQRQAQMIQQYQLKLQQMESQLQKMRERQAKSLEENASKMKKLQQKMDQMQQALRQREKAIQSNYQAQMQQLQNSLLRLSQQLQQKMIRIDQLNEAVIILQGQNKDLSKQLQDNKYQIQQQKHVFEAELTRLKNKLKEAEGLYATNLKALQEELLRNAQKNNTSNSRLKGVDGEERVARRYEQKIKTKERKIQQLKQSIYALEETILRLRKKQSAYEGAMGEVEHLKLSIIQFQKQRKNIESKYEEELNRNCQTIRQLKRELLISRESQERYKLIAQQKTLQNDSIGSQLKTMRELYQQLQRELQKRKMNLTMQIQSEGQFQLELSAQQARIMQLQQRLLEAQRQARQWQTQLKKKNIECRRHSQQYSQIIKREQMQTQTISKLSAQLSTAKKSLSDGSSTWQSTKSELTKSRAELTRLRKSTEQLKASCVSKQQSLTQLQNLSEELSLRVRQNEQIALKYSALNQRAREHLGYGLQQVLDKFLMHLQTRQNEIGQLMEEIQELKFMSERKYLDYDELRKENFQLQIRAEDAQVLNEQVQNLRKICDKLEQQKKHSVFRQEVLRMQLQNLANNGSQDLRSRIDAILGSPSLPSYGNFSFYA